MKILNLDNLSISLEDIQKEVTTMKSCKHPNVLECYTSFVTKNYLWIVMPYMSMGSCHRIISKLRELGLIAEGEGLRV